MQTHDPIEPSLHIAAISPNCPQPLSINRVSGSVPDPIFKAASAAIDNSTTTPESLSNDCEAEASTDHTTRLDWSIPFTQKRRLGHLILGLLISTTIALVASVAFLRFLWWGKHDSPVWLKFMRSKRETPWIPLTAVVIRMSISFQAGIATSMLASVAIESRGIPLQNLAVISLARFTNSGPLMLFYNFMEGLRISVRFWLHATTFLLGCTTLLSQLTSTLLLTDLGQGPIIGPSRNRTTRYGIMEKLGINQSIPMQTFYRSVIPPEFESFAEYSKPSTSEDLTLDTGLTLRSLLPFSYYKMRTHLRNYSGPALVYDARIYCSAPVIQELKIETTQRTSLIGKIKPATGKKPGLVSNSTGVAFNCSSSTAIENSGDLAWTLCGLDTSAGGLIPMLDPWNNESLDHHWGETTRHDGSQGWIASYLNSSWDVELGHAYLIMNLTKDMTVAESQEGTLQSAFGPWNIFAFQNSRNITVPVHMSMCFDAIHTTSKFSSQYHAQDFDIMASATHIHGEPDLHYDQHSKRFDTDEIRKQLGAKRTTHTKEERGIMELNPTFLFSNLAEATKAWDPSMNRSSARWTSSSEHTYPLILKDAWDNLLRIPTNTSSIFSFKGSLIHDWGEMVPVSPLHATTFADIIEDTGSPALAIQAFQTMIIRQAYYDLIAYFDVTASVHNISWQDNQVPFQTRGFWIVLGIILTHLLLLGTITRQFFRLTRYTLLQNAWQTVSQLATSPEILDVLENASLSVDSEITKRIRNADMEAKIVRLERLPASEKLGFVAVEAGLAGSKDI